MRLGTALAAGSFGLMFLLGLLQAQRPFREYPAIEYDDFPCPPIGKISSTNGSGRVFAILISTVIRTIRA
jgi:hypothetical protein